MICSSNSPLDLQFRHRRFDFPFAGCVPHRAVGIVDLVVLFVFPRGAGRVHCEQALNKEPTTKEAEACFLQDTIEEDQCETATAAVACYRKRSLWTQASVWGESHATKVKWTALVCKMLVKLLFSTVRSVSKKKNGCTKLIVTTRKATVNLKYHHPVIGRSKKKFYTTNSV